MPILVSKNRSHEAARTKVIGSRKQTARAWLSPSDRILLAIQFWNGDKQQAMRLCRFITDLEPTMCDHADFLFVSRFDTPQDADTVDYVSSKFRVFTHKSRRRGVGWPIGCNELWAGTTSHIYQSIGGKKMPAYKAVLTFESDCVPMQHGWIQRLSSQWDEEKRANNGALAAMGAWLRWPGPHLNGNMMISGDPHHLSWLSDAVSSVGGRGGWDYIIYPQLERRGIAQVSTIRSYWGSKTMTREWFEREVQSDAVFIHGVKDDSLLSMSRKRLLGK